MHLCWSQVFSDQDCASLGFNGSDWLWFPKAVDCDMGFGLDDYYKQGTALRFLNIDIPRGSHIASARLRLCAWTDYDVDVVRSFINAQLDANPHSFTTISDYWARPRTSPGLPWDNIRHFTHRSWYHSPNFKDQVQQIIDLPDWHIHNPMVIFWNDHGDRSDHIPVCTRHAYAYSTAPARAPYLQITYTLPTEPTPPPVPDDHFAPENLEYILTKTGYRIIYTTDVPCHLYMRWSTTEPQIHHTPVRRRGITLSTDIRICFVVYKDNEQLEEGDTITHTFIKEPWAHCETRWFYFHGTIAGNTSVSTSPVFKKHRQLPDYWLLINEPWHVTYDPPDFTLVHSEPWTS